MVMTTGTLEEALTGFRTAVRGSVLRPGDAGYDEARRVWNGTIDRRPALIVRCAGAADAIAAVQFARAQGLAVAVRGGGHNVAGNAICEGGLVIDLSQMKGIRVDPENRTARAEAGVTWGEFDQETQAFGLATTGGTVSTTGIAGLTLGGGVGWLMGKYGATVDNLLAVDIVTADGQLVHASAAENSDLFWAVRGAGANYGVVTSFEYRLHPVGPMVLGGMIMYPLAAATEVLRFFREFSRTAPDELTAYAGLLTAPQGMPVAAIALCYAGPIEEGERLVAPLRSFGTPIADLLGPLPYTALQGMLDAALPAGRRYYWKSHGLRSLDDGAIEAIAARFGRVPSPLSIVLIEHHHGAVNRVGPEATAFHHRTSPYDLIIVSAWEGQMGTEVNVAWARELLEATRPYANDSVYVNVLDRDDSARIGSAYGANIDRLRELKRRYDPRNVFCSNQNIAPHG